jgi:hypothetical protein
VPELQQLNPFGWKQPESPKNAAFADAFNLPTIPAVTIIL